MNFLSLFLHLLAKQKNPFQIHFLICPVALDPLFLV